MYTIMLHAVLVTKPTEQTVQMVVRPCSILVCAEHIGAYLLDHTPRVCYLYCRSICREQDDLDDLQFYRGRRLLVDLTHQVYA